MQKKTLAFGFVLVHTVLLLITVYMLTSSMFTCMTSPSTHTTLRHLGWEIQTILPFSMQYSHENICTRPGVFENAHAHRHTVPDLCAWELCSKIVLIVYRSSFGKDTSPF